MKDIEIKNKESCCEMIEAHTASTAPYLFPFGSIRPYSNNKWSK